MPNSSNSTLLFCLLILFALFANGCGSTAPTETVAPLNEQKVDSKEVVENVSQSAVVELAQQPVSVSLDEMSQRRDPSKDGWSTEVLNEQAMAQLNQLGAWLSKPDQMADSMAGVVHADIQHSQLRPDTNLSFSDTVEIKRGREQLPIDASGLVSFQKSFQELAAAFEGSTHVHFKFKVVRVNESGDGVSTEVLFQADDREETQSIQINAKWLCGWVRVGDVLKLTRLGVQDYVEVHGKFSGGTLFADCTESVLGLNPVFEQQLMKSTNHWRSQLQGALGLDLFGHQGMAIGDANGDGLEDLYVCQPGGVTNRLFIQQPDGTAIDRSKESATDYLDRTRAALFLDLDNDDDQDLVMVVDADLLFLENDGNGVFKESTSTFIGTCVTLAAADFDNDGDVDIYVCGYSAPRGGEGAPTPYHDANNGLPNRLLRNDIKEQWSFTDVTYEVGLDQNNTRYTLSAAWEDFDNDGDQDLYVANDFGRNNLYRNDNGKFKDIAAEAGVEDMSAGMGIAWGDYNQDGLLDIYVSNMFSSAGNRVAYQRKFRQGEDESQKAEFQRHARGNSLFENVGDGTFRDVSENAQVMMGRWSWGSLFCDLNNDSHLDLLVTNGLVTNEDTDDL